jgi:hypothetical protein
MDESFKEFRRPEFSLDFLRRWWNHVRRY